MYDYKYGLGLIALEGKAKKLVEKMANEIEKVKKIGRENILDKAELKNARIIKVKRDSHYGKTYHYPLTHVKALKDLTGNKTLTYTHLEALKSMGFKFELVSEPLEV